MKNYEQLIFQFGILSILFVLEHYQEVENYEECKQIIDTLDRIESKRGIKLPIKIDEETEAIVIHSYKKFNLTGINAVSNSMHYADLIINGEIK